MNITAKEKAVQMNAENRRVHVIPNVESVLATPQIQVL